MGLDFICLHCHIFYLLHFWAPMKASRLMPLSEVFVSIPDPRSKRHAKRDLSELLTVAWCGADSYISLALGRLHHRLLLGSMRLINEKV